MRPISDPRGSKTTPFEPVHTYIPQKYPPGTTPPHYPPPSPSSLHPALDRRKYVLYCRYVAWQVHERVEGEYDFEGENDLVNFTKLAGSLGLLVIIRAGKRKTMNGKNF